MYKMGAWGGVRGDTDNIFGFSALCCVVGNSKIVWRLNFAWYICCIDVATASSRLGNVTECSSFLSKHSSKFSYFNIDSIFNIASTNGMWFYWFYLVLPHPIKYNTIQHSSYLTTLLVHSGPARTVPGTWFIDSMDMNADRCACWLNCWKLWNWLNLLIITNKATSQIYGSCNLKARVVINFIEIVVFDRSR